VLIENGHFKLLSTLLKKLEKSSSRTTISNTHAKDREFFNLLIINHIKCSVLETCFGEQDCVKKIDRLTAQYRVNSQQDRKEKDPRQEFP
jgi:hypothetical protein